MKQLLAGHTRPDQTKPRFQRFRGMVERIDDRICDGINIPIERVERYVGATRDQTVMVLGVVAFGAFINKSSVGAAGLGILIGVLSRSIKKLFSGEGNSEFLKPAEFSTKLLRDAMLGLAIFAATINEFTAMAISLVNGITFHIIDSKHLKPKDSIQ